MFRLANVDGRAALVEGDHWYDLAVLGGDEALAEPMAAVARHPELHDLQARAADRSPSGDVADTLLGACVPRPSKVFAIGLNYRAHAAESNLELPTAPVTFTKFPSCLAGPTADVVLSGPTVDWEVELVVVIGHGGRHVSADDAWAHVAGLCLGQDISDRTVQLNGNPAQFSLGKSFDTYGPIGPAVVSVDAFTDPDDIGIWCEVAGERMQEARTTDLIFPVPELVEHLSSICTLEPGDLIFTGTPSGVGAPRGRFLQDGEVIVSGAEVIGELRNRCVAR
ncbi:MAG TPA: fumarylacetoacetate hydrolase family protein [Acidimicrobiales bacterium]|nr:fumarylacetoacetate hydrolase family protein [Acidimicrobiales bacterium]